MFGVAMFGGPVFGRSVFGGPVFERDLGLHID